MDELKQRIADLEKQLTDFKTSNITEKPAKINKTKQSQIDASKAYYHRNKTNLDFRIKIRDRNRTAYKKKEIVEQKEPENTKEIKIIKEPITISFYDDNESLGF